MSLEIGNQLERYTNTYYVCEINIEHTDYDVCSHLQFLKCSTLQVSRCQTLNPLLESTD